MIGSTFFGNTLQAPRWAADYLDREHLEPWAGKIDPSQFSDSAGIPVTVTASAIATATSITVAALAPSLYPATALIASGNVLLKSGTVLDFGGGKFARLTADALVGATTLTVAALPTALVGNETTTYTPFGSETIPSGTIVGRTWAERDSGTAFGPGATTDDEFFLVAFDVVNARVDNDIVLYRHHSRVKENYLPGYTTLNAAGNAVDTATITGTLSAGTFAIVVNGTSTGPIAYNANLAAIQAALDAAFGINGVVAAGTVASHTLTYSGTGYAGTNPTTSEDISALTGATKVAIVRTTPNGSAILTKLRSLYSCIKGTD